MASPSRRGGVRVACCVLPSPVRTAQNTNGTPNTHRVISVKPLRGAGRFNGSTVQRFNQTTSLHLPLQSLEFLSHERAHAMFGQVNSSDTDSERLRDFRRRPLFQYVEVEYLPLFQIDLRFDLF